MKDTSPSPRRSVRAGPCVGASLVQPEDPGPGCLLASSSCPQPGRSWTKWQMPYQKMDQLYQGKIYFPVKGAHPPRDTPTRPPLELDFFLPPSIRVISLRSFESSPNKRPFPAAIASRAQEWRCAEGPIVHGVQGSSQGAHPPSHPCFSPPG